MAFVERKTPDSQWGRQSLGQAVPDHRFNTMKSDVALKATGLSHGTKIPSYL